LYPRDPRTRHIGTGAASRWAAVAMDSALSARGLLAFNQNINSQAMNSANLARLLADLAGAGGILKAVAGVTDRLRARGTGLA
jgi:hypothetical protein